MKWVCIEKYCITTTPRPPKSGERFQKQKRRPSGRRFCFIDPFGSILFKNYERCFETKLVISNMFTVALPPNTFFKEASALIFRLFFSSWSLFFLMYAQRAFTTSDRGIGPFPTTAARSALTVIGFMNAELTFFAAGFAAFGILIILITYASYHTIPPLGPLPAPFDSYLSREVLSAELLPNPKWQPRIMHHDVEEDAVTNNRHNERKKCDVHNLLSSLLYFIERTNPLLTTEIQDETPCEQHETNNTECPAIVAVKTIGERRRKSGGGQAERDENKRAQTTQGCSQHWQTGQFEKFF